MAAGLYVYRWGKRAFASLPLFIRIRIPQKQEDWSLTAHLEYPSVNERDNACHALRREAGITPYALCLQFFPIRRCILLLFSSPHETLSQKIIVYRISKNATSTIHWYFTDTSLTLYWCFTDALLMLYWQCWGMLLNHDVQRSSLFPRAFRCWAFRFWQAPPFTYIEYIVLQAVEFLSFLRFLGQISALTSACYFILHSIFVKCGLSRVIIWNACERQRTHTCVVLAYGLIH